jgi:hypothetical protein
MHCAVSGQQQRSAMTSSSTRIGSSTLSPDLKAQTHLYRRSDEDELRRPHLLSRSSRLF